MTPPDTPGLATAPSGSAAEPPPATRIERDALGEVQVPAAALWGAQTQRSLELFRISDERMPVEIVQALARIKQAAADVNADLGLLDRAVARAIVQAAHEVLRGEHADAFPLRVWQTGSGTQTNMNLNEVLANRASELLGGGRGAQRRVHPNDQVNLGQSSNDAFPTAIHLAAALGVANGLLPALDGLRAALQRHVEAHAGIVKVGRTHLQDAVPLTLGQEFSGYVAQLDHARRAIEAARPAIHELAIGGTAVGTGLNTHPQFGARVAERLGRDGGLPLVSAPNKFAAIASHDAAAQLHAALKTLAVALMKIANDLRWLASGPRCGLGEINLPANEPGSSIMPGKVNPTQCEALTMVCAQVMGNDVAVTVGASLGQFELNAFKPLIAHNLLQSLRLLADGMRSFDVHCVAGITVNAGRIAGLLEHALMTVTALAPHIGYDRAAQIAHHAHAEGSSLRQAALAQGVAAEDFDRWVRPERMV